MEKCFLRIQILPININEIKVQLKYHNFKIFSTYSQFTMNSNESNHCNSGSFNRTEVDKRASEIMLEVDNKNHSSSDPSNENTQSLPATLSAEDNRAK
ncbi:unnamed protein product [Rotaria magnacalcarata]